MGHQLYPHSGGQDRVESLNSPLSLLELEIADWLEYSKDGHESETPVIVFFESQPENDLEIQEATLSRIGEMLSERGYLLHVIHEAPIDQSLETSLKLKLGSFNQFKSMLMEGYTAVELWNATAPFRAAAWNLATYRLLSAINKTQPLRGIREKHPTAVLFTGAGLMNPTEIRASGLFNSVYSEYESPSVIETPFSRTVRDYEEMLWRRISESREYSTAQVLSIIKEFKFEESISSLTIVPRILADFVIFIKSGDTLDPNCAKVISEGLLRESHNMAIAAMDEANGHPAIAMSLIAKKLGYKPRQYLPEPVAHEVPPMDV